MPKIIDTTKQLGTDSIWRLLARFSIPSIISMTVSAVYNIADRVFIGKFVGEHALGGLTAAFPLMMILISFGSLFAVGATSLISIEFGKKNREKANQIYTNAMVMVFASCVLLTSIAHIFLPQLLSAMGATVSNLPYAVDYMRIILLGMVFQFPSFTLASFARVEGQPRLSMASQLVAGTANIILDYLFTAVWAWGVRGAAIATVMGQFIGFAILLWYFFFSGKSMLRMKLRAIRLEFQTIKRICEIGAASFFAQVSNSISGALLNMALSTYGGDAAMTSAGAMSSMVTLAFMPILGLQQGLGPIIGYNHGMQRNDRVRSALYRGISVGMGISTLIFILLEVFPSVFASLFIDPSSATMQLCVRAMRISFLTMPFLSINIVGSSYFQSTAQAAKSLLLNTSRAVIFLIPLILILPRFLGLDGAWAAQPAADVFSIALTILFLYRSVPKRTAAAR